MEKFIDQVVADCFDYAARYNMTVLEAVDDWEGDGPSGSWGLTLEEKELVIEKIKGEKNETAQ